VKNKLLEIRKFYEEKIKSLRADKTQIAGDLALITMNETKETVRELEREIRQELTEAENDFEKLRGVSALLTDAASKYENEVGNFLHGIENLQHRESTKEVWREIFFKAVDIGDHMDQEYQGDFLTFDKYYIVNLNSEYVVKKNSDNAVVDKLTINQQNGIDTEDRILKFRNWDKKKDYFI